MVRKCSHCGHDGHNLRTCRISIAGDGLKLFGVHLKKSFSMEFMSSPTLSPPSTSSSSSSSSSSFLFLEEPADKQPLGYLSDVSRTHQDRKKGIPWTEEEHRAFITGLEKLGKGDWRGISRNFVITRTPTQVASHAQKYFLRQTSLHKKRRSSLFDVVNRSAPPPLDLNLAAFGQGTAAAKPQLNLELTISSPRDFLTLS